MAGGGCSLIIALLLCVLWVIVCWALADAQLNRASARAIGQHVLKPRTPDDCPACRCGSDRSLVVLPPPPTVRPWRDLKSRRGRPKQSATDGFACPNPACAYFRITDAGVTPWLSTGHMASVSPSQPFAAKRAEPPSPLGAIRPSTASRRPPRESQKS